MEMSIDEHIAQLKKLKSFHNGSYGASINFALDIIRKYQKIDWITQAWDDDENAMILVHKIRADIYSDVCDTIKGMPTVEAIPEADYEARLKADMVAILEDLDLKIDEMYEPQFSKEGMDGFYWAQGLFKDLVQKEINALKEAADDQSGAG